MIELLHAALAWVNLPLSFLLGLVILYWLAVIFGAIGADALEIGGDADLDLDLDADLEGDGPAGWHGFLSFFSVGDLPFMLVFSIFTVTVWTLGVLSQHYLSQERVWLGIALYLPIFLIGALVTKFSALILVHLYRKVDDSKPAPESVVGHICVLTSACSPKRLAQGEVEVEGAPFRVTVRTHRGTLEKGARALILEKDESRDFYYVEAFD